MASYVGCGGCVVVGREGEGGRVERQGLGRGGGGVGECREVGRLG